MSEIYENEQADIFGHQLGLSTTQSLGLRLVAMPSRSLTCSGAVETSAFKSRRTSEISLHEAT